MPAPPPIAAHSQAPQLQLLSTALLTVPGQQAAVLANKDAVLLASLALEGPGSREALAALLWQDKPAAGARANLRQRISRLQEASAHALLVSDGDKLSLAPSVQHDLGTIETALQADPQAAQGSLLGNLQLSNSPNAAGWLDRARQHVTALRLRTLQAHATQLEENGQLEAALAYTRRLVAEDPLLEQGHRQLMRLHYRRGELAAATDAYQRLRQALADDLGVEPDAQTTELMHLVERAQAAAVLPPAAPAAAARPALRAALLRPPQLLQRETEWQQLAHTWAYGGTAIVLGEAGMGKTRLLNDFADSVGLKLRLHAKPGDHAVPYALLSRWVAAQLPAAQALPDWARSELARLAPELGPAPPGNLIPLRLVKALALVQPLGGAALVDDLHFADEASLDLLPAVLQNIRCGLLGTRSEDGPAWLQSWLDRMGRAAKPITLAPLQEPSQFKLAETVLHHPASQPLSPLEARAAVQLLRQSGGNPLFALELLRHALPNGFSFGAPWPSQTERQDLADLFRRRLTRLSPTALRLAQVAALAGSDFSAGLAAAVSGLHELDLVNAWQELEFNQLMNAEGMTSDALCEATAADVPAAIARAVSARVAEYLVNSAAPPARAALMWEKAGHPRAAWLQWDRAATNAKKASRRGEELELLDRAEKCALQVGEARAAFALALRAVAAAHVVQSTEQTAQRINHLLARDAPAELALDALLMHCKHLVDKAMHADALAPCQQAHLKAQQTGLPHQRLQSAAWYGISLTACGRHEEAHAVFAEASGEVPKCSQLDALADYEGAKGSALFSAGRYTEALPALQYAARQSEALGDLHEAMVQCTNVSVCQSQLGQRQSSLESAQQSLALWVRLGEPAGHDAASCHTHAGAAFTTKGWFDHALHSLKWALSVFEVAKEANANWITMTEFRLARLYTRLGRPDLGKQCIRPLGAQASLATRLIEQALRCKLARQTDQDNVQRLETALNLADHGVSDADRLVAELTLVSIQTPERALPRLQRVLQRCDGSQQHLVRVHALARLADALFKLDQTSYAGETALQALRAFEVAPPVDMESPEFWWLVWRPLEAAGYLAEAGAVLVAAKYWMDEATKHVPDEFKQSFLHQNPFVAQLRLALRNRVVA